MMALCTEEKSSCIAVHTVCLQKCYYLAGMGPVTYLFHCHYVIGYPCGLLEKEMAHCLVLW